jgi:tRNA (mo5U34)-methyltransferase
MKAPTTLPDEVGLPSPPCGFSSHTCFQGVHWHQRWEIFKGIFTPGGNPVKDLCALVELPGDLSGKHVLDVGAWNGCFSFECERRGAAEVVAFGPEDPEVVGFNRLKKLLGSKVEYVTGSVYTLSPRDLGTFDVILFLGVLYHLRYPLLALDRLRSVSCGDVYVETHVIDNSPWLRGPMRFLSKLPLFRPAWRRTPIWRQYREYELHPRDQSNWFGPNKVAVLEAFQSAGFEIAHTRSWGDRASFRAQVTDRPSRLLHYTYESQEANREMVGLAEPDAG